MNALAALSARREEIAGKRIVVGFDGFTDTIAKPLRRTPESGPPAVFGTIREFGEFLAGREERSCSVGLSVLARRIGGNAPLLSVGAARLGLNVSCIGMLGEGAPEKLFGGLPCALYPYAASGKALCLEFCDGKLMFSSDCVLPQDAWSLVLASTQGGAPSLLDDADGIALVNWSELSFAQSLWERTLTCLKTPDRRRFAFFDLCDVSRRNGGQLRDVLELIGSFSSVRTAVLSLNGNEALTAAALLPESGTELTEIASGLRRRYGMDEVIIHTARGSLLCTPRGVTCRPTRFAEKPATSTGAGDNFNAASLLGALLGLSDGERLELANACAYFYVSRGCSPSLGELEDTLKSS